MVSSIVETIIKFKWSEMMVQRGVYICDKKKWSWPLISLGRSCWESLEGWIRVKRGWIEREWLVNHPSVSSSVKWSLFCCTQIRPHRMTMIRRETALTALIKTVKDCGGKLHIEPLDLSKHSIQSHCQSKKSGEDIKGDTDDTNIPGCKSCTVPLPGLCQQLYSSPEK